MTMGKRSPFCVKWEKVLNSNWGNEMRYYYATSECPLILQGKKEGRKEEKNSKDWPGCKATGFKSCWWECKYHNHLETVSQFFYKIKHTFYMWLSNPTPLLTFTQSKRAPLASLPCQQLAPVIVFVWFSFSHYMGYVMASHYGFNLHIPKDYYMLFSWKVKWNL